jgi:hypothetical protein
MLEIALAATVEPGATYDGRCNLETTVSAVCAPATGLEA